MTQFKCTVVNALRQETNVLGFKGPRKMTIILPGMTEDSHRVALTQATEAETLVGV